MGAVGARLLRVRPREDPDRIAAGPGGPASSRRHHPRPTTADDGRPSLRQQPADLLRQPPDLAALLAFAAADDGDLTRALRREGAGVDGTSKFVTETPAS